MAITTIAVMTWIRRDLSDPVRKAGMPNLARVSIPEVSYRPMGHLKSWKIGPSVRGSSVVQHGNSNLHSHFVRFLAYIVYIPNPSHRQVQSCFIPPVSLASFA